MAFILPLPSLVSPKTLPSTGLIANALCSFLWLWPRNLRSMSIALCPHFRLEGPTFLTMATFWLLPYSVTTFSYRSSPSWRMITHFKAPDYCHNFRQPLLFIHAQLSYNKQLSLQKLLHSQDTLLKLFKFQVYWESESLGSIPYIYSYKHIAWLSVYGRTQSLSFDSHCLLLLYAETIADSTPLKNSLPWQWPASSLSAEEEMVVTTACPLAIALVHTG